VQAETSNPIRTEASVGWLRRDLRAVPVAVWAAVVLNLLLMLVYTTLQPAYRGLDEAAHIDMVVSLPNPLDWPAPGEKTLSHDLRATYDEAGHDGLPFARLARDIAQQPKSERPDFTEAGTLDRPGEATNQMVQHPPLYYVVVAAGMELVPGTEQWAFDRQIALMRFLSLLMVAPLPLLCWLAARRLRLSTTLGVVAAFLPLTMPSVQRVGASVSNDALLIGLIGAVNVVAIAVAAGDLRRRTSVGLGLLCAAAMLVKGLALVLPVALLLTYAVAVYRARDWRPVLVPAVIAGGIAGVLGGGWYVRNLVLFGAVQPNGYPGGDLPYERLPGGGFSAWWPTYLEAMLFRFWSALGQPEPPQLGEDLSKTLTVALLVLMVGGLLVASGQRTLVGVALLPFAGLTSLVAIGAYVNYQAYDRFIGVQGRYLYPALVGMTVAAAIALGRLTGPWRAGLPVVVLTGAGVLQFLAARAVLETYWTTAQAPGRLSDGFSAMQAWSPLPDLVVQGLWIATVLVGLATAATALLLLVRREGRPAPSRPVSPAAEAAACVS